MQRKLPFSADPFHRIQRPTKARLDPLTYLWVNGQLRLDFELGTEKTKAGKLARRENLNMKVIHLKYGDHAELVDDLCDLIRAGGDKVNGEAEKVLRVWIAPDGAILKIVPPPACKLRIRSGFDDPEEALEELDIDR